MHLRARPMALFALSLLFLPRLGAGALTWGKDRISTEVIQGEQAEVNAAFPFKNNGDHPVTITGVETSCGCTTAGLDKRTYATGESGEIAVVFHPAESTGLQEKYITVTTNEPNQLPTQLLLEVNIKEYLTIEPRLLAWKLGEKPSEQLIVVSALPSRPITELTAQGALAGVFETRIETVEKGQKYHVYVKPVSIAARLSTAVTIQVKFGNNTERKTEVYVYVNPPDASQTND